MAFEVIGCNAFISSTLAGDAALQAAVRAARQANGVADEDLSCGFVYLDAAPEVDAATGRLPVYPFIVFSLQASVDRLGNGGRRVMTLPILYLRAIGEGNDLAPLQSIASRMDALIHGAGPADVTFGLETFQILGALRKTTIQRPAYAEGQVHSSLGGTYQFYTAAT